MKYLGCGKLNCVNIIQKRCNNLGGPGGQMFVRISIIFERYKTKFIGSR